MKKHFYHLLLLFLIAGFTIACSDSKDKDPLNNVEVEKELSAIVNKLDDIAGVEQFTSALKNVQLDVKTQKLTILATQDTKNEASASAKSTSPKATAELISKDNIKRHIIEGNHDFLNMSKDTMTVKSVDGTTLYITKNEGSIFINGVKLTSKQAEKISESLIFVIQEVLPKDYTPSPVEEPKFVLNIEAKRCLNGVDNIANPYGISKGLKIRFYTQNEGIFQAVDSITTDQDGKAVYKHNIETNLYYKVASDSLTNLYDGCLVTGVFTTQQEINDYPPYRFYYSNYSATIGGLKLNDDNQDGQITEKDEVDTYPLTVGTDDNLLIYVIPYNSMAVEDFFTTKQHFVEYTEAVSNRSATFMTSLRVLEYRLSDSIAFAYEYPHLTALESPISSLYVAHYQLVNLYLLLDKHSANFAPYQKDLFAEFKSQRDMHTAQLVTSYLTMVDHFGGIPLITKSLSVEEAAGIKRSTVEEVVAYAEMLSSRLDGDSRFGAIQALARHYLNAETYNNAAIFAEEIIGSGKFALAADSLDAGLASNSKELILPGVVFNSDFQIPHKGASLPMARYTETLLIAVEAIFKLGNTQKALTYYNQLEQRAGNPSATTLTIEDIRKQYAREMNMEGQWYTSNAVRWNTLSSIVPNAAPYNKLLPIPRSEMDRNPNMVQNPGY